jgi:8-oxo-dGTP pyrophosphatase MutT (NUDIX family)
MGRLASACDTDIHALRDVDIRVSQPSDRDSATGRQPHAGEDSLTVVVAPGRMTRMGATAGAWTRRGSRPAYSGFVRVRRDEYLMPDGQVAGWDVLEDADSVVVLAFTEGARSLLTVEQFRVGPARMLVELPGGMVDAGEAPEVAGIRELREETGYRPGSVFSAGSEWAAANSQRRKHAIVAADCVPVGRAGWEWEPGIEVGSVPIASVSEMLRGGELTDAGEAFRALHVFAQGVVPDVMAATQAAVRRLLTT